MSAVAILSERLVYHNALTQRFVAETSNSGGMVVIGKREGLVPFAMDICTAMS
jgi:hypothetical protein